MMNKVIAHLTAASVASLSVTTLAHAASETYDLTGFTYIDASAGVDVEISVGGAYSVRAEGKPEALERLRLERNGDALEIGRIRDRSYFSLGRIWRVTVYVTMPDLNGVDVSSGADVSATGIDAGKFSASVSSGADAILSGRCTNLAANGSSGADLRASKLECADTVADVSSGADLVIYASNSLEANASSGGDIVVYGGPQNTDIEKSSGGDVTIRN